VSFLMLPLADVASCSCTDSRNIQLTWRPLHYPCLPEAGWIKLGKNTGLRLGMRSPSLLPSML
jgi:hypothetical protein